MAIWGGAYTGTTEGQDAMLLCLSKNIEVRGHWMCVKIVKFFTLDEDYCGGIECGHSGIRTPPLWNRNDNKWGKSLRGRKFQIEIWREASAWRIPQLFNQQYLSDLKDCDNCKAPPPLLFFVGGCNHKSLRLRIFGTFQQYVWSSSPPPASLWGAEERERQTATILSAAEILIWSQLAFNPLLHLPTPIQDNQKSSASGSAS